LTFDFPKGEARLLLDLWVGDLHSKDPDIRERYNRAILFVEKLGFWISGPTDPSNYPLNQESMCIDIRLLPDNYNPGVLLPANTSENPIYYMYSTDINTCFYFSCESARLQWLNQGA
jgi:hypothetical protein